MPAIPSIHTLMDDPLFRAYMKKVPAYQHANSTGHPWQLWVDRGRGRWGTTTRATYADMWQVFLHHYRAGDGRDVTLVSRRVFYAPPGEWYRQKVRRPRRPTPDNKATSHIVIEDRWRQKFFWEGLDLHWCGRCRRPVVWMPLFDTHHALRRMPAIAPDDNYRCIICGIRWIAQPQISDMVKMERKS